MSKSFNRVLVETATVGAGTLTFGVAPGANIMTFAEAGAVDGDIVNYIIEDGTDFEAGVGTIAAGVTQLVRTTVKQSKIGGVVGTSKIPLSGTARVRSAEIASFFNDTVLQKNIAVIDNLADVDTTTTPPNAGEGLVWDGTKYIPGPAGGGMFRGNNSTVGNRSGDIFRINAKTLTMNVTIGATENASATGPLEVGTGVTLEVATGGTLVII